MDGENDEFLWEIYCKNIQSKEVFGKLMYFETEFFVTEGIKIRDMFHVSAFPDKSLNRLVLTCFIFTFTI